MKNLALARSQSGIALLACTLVLCIFGLSHQPQQAQAGTSTYCVNQTLGDHAMCNGAERTLYRTYGWGGQHSVCVWASYGTPSGAPLGGSGYKACSSGPEAGVYSPAYFENIANMFPGISNNAAGNNLVNGVALTH